MSEKDVPVGLLRFLYDMFVRCKFSRAEPFRSCCNESIFGSWSPSFLWLKLRKRCDCNRGCKDCCSWSSIFKTFGALVLMIILPLPYYIRVAFFYMFEEDEMKDRRNATDLLELDYKIDHNLLQWMTPTHPCLIGVYGAYIVCFLVIAALRACDHAKIDGIMQGCVTDMRRINRIECLRMICAHLLLPFEKFGIFGIPVAILYWPFVLPICLLVSLIYSIPMLYMTGRLIIHSRPACLRQLPTPPSPSHPINSISNGTTSFSSCFLLDSVSPDSRIFPPQPASDKNASSGRKKRHMFALDSQKLAVGCGTSAVGLLMVVWIYTLMLMYAEGIGFILEVCIMSILGAILNAGQSILYVVFGFLCVVYIALCYRWIYLRYAAFSRQIFAGIKLKLGDSIQEVSILRQDKKKNTAFKYFSHDEIKELENLEMTMLLTSSALDDQTLDSTAQTSNGVPPAGSRNKPLMPMSNKPDMQDLADTIEYINNRLHWKVNSLALFVDKNDISRIPRDLFWQICKLDVPGRPGPLHRSIIAATGRLLVVLLYLVFLFIIILSFGNVYEISSTNQMFVTLASGCIPLAIYLISRAFCHKSNLSDYSFGGKICRTIMFYNRTWPIFDLSFIRTGLSGVAQNSRIVTGRKGVTGGPGQRPLSQHHPGSDCQPDEMEMTNLRSTNRRVVSRSRQDDPTAIQVDLLITVRDEMDQEENIRSEPVSLGSGLSINSGNRYDRPSPDEVNQVQQRSNHNTREVSYSATGGSACNQPTNASRAPAYTPLPNPTENSADNTATLLIREGPEKTKPASSSISSIPNQNHAAVAAPSSSQKSDLVVVDMTDDSVVVSKRSSMGIASSRNTASLRSLPIYDKNRSSVTSESAL